MATRGLALLLAVAVLAVLAPQPTSALAVLGNCTTCPDHAQTCCNGEICCEDTTPGSYFCCSAHETCCKGTCCIEQTTFCCPKTQLHPDRCCPRWSVCCTAGVSEGCCEPQTLRPLTAAEMASPFPPSAMLAARAAVPATIYALFLETVQESSTLKVLTINGQTGAISDPQTVAGFNAWGEMTREFVFNPQKEVFYYLEANFTVPRPSSGRQLRLYTVDPKSGQATSQIVQGAVDFPSGFAFDEASGKLVVATWRVGQSAPPGGQDTPVGYNFYTIDPSTAAATKIGATAGIADADAYAGYFQTCSLGAGLCYRLGYFNVTTQTNPGLGVTRIAASPTSTSWATAPVSVPVPDNQAFYVSFNLYKDRYLSLSPSDKVGADLDLFSWTTNGTATMISNMGGNAHSPLLFGPIAEEVAGDVYLAAVVKHGAVPVLSRWVVVAVELDTGKTHELDLSPRLIAETCSVSGLGVPASARH